MFQTRCESTAEITDELPVMWRWENSITWRIMGFSVIVRPLRFGTGC